MIWGGAMLPWVLGGRAQNVIKPKEFQYFCVSRIPKYLQEIRKYQYHQGFTSKSERPKWRGFEGPETYALLQVLKPQYL